MIEDSKEYWLRVEDTHIIMSEKSTLLQLLHFFIKYINEKKTHNITKYELNKIMSIQSKDSSVCQKSRDSTANHIFSRS